MTTITIERATVEEWKVKVNTLAATTTKADRYALGAALKQRMADALSSPATAPEQEASVKQVDANNYCLILRLLGMEEEGDPVAEVERLRKDSERMREALTFYAEGDHFTFDRDAWDTVSDEPQNYWCDEAGTATVEDGTIAKLALDAATKETP